VSGEGEQSYFYRWSQGLNYDLALRTVFGPGDLRGCLKSGVVNPICSNGKEPVSNPLRSAFDIYRGPLGGKPRRVFRQVLAAVYWPGTCTLDLCLQSEGIEKIATGAKRHFP